MFPVDQRRRLLWQVKIRKISVMRCSGLRRFKATLREKEMSADADADLSVWGKPCGTEGVRDRHNAHLYGGSMGYISASSVIQTHMNA